MREKMGKGAVAAAALALAASGTAALSTPARAEVAASEVLTWCSGASQSGQLGAINAFRCVNYLQGAADMVRALVDVDLDACLDGSQSAGAQLMARFIPELKSRAAGEDIDAVPVAQHVADWLAGACQVELTVAAAAPTEEPAEPVVDELQAAALAEAEADAAALADQVRDLQAALEVAVTGQDQQLASCTAAVDELTAALATSEAQAADSGMLVTELELELEGVNAEAIARRQEIVEAEQQVAALTADLHVALADRLAVERALTDAKRELNALSATAAETSSAAATADEAVAAAAEQVAAAEQRMAAAENRLGEVQSALSASEAERERMAIELQQLTATASDHAAQLASLSGDLDACRVTVASAEPSIAPAPAPTPARSGAITVPNIVTTPQPDPASSNSGGSSSSITRGGGDPRPLDAVGIQSLRQMQQVTLRQNSVGQRRSWATPDGRYTGFVMVLREGYNGPDYCREVYSEARSDSFVVHQSTELYCQNGNLWIYIP